MNKISSKLNFISLTLSFLILAILTMSIIINNRDKRDALTINIAGKERMLTQKMGKEIFYALHQKKPNFKYLDSTVEEFEHNLANLMKGNNKIAKPATPMIKNELSNIYKEWKNYYNLIISLKNTIGEYSKNKYMLDSINENFEEKVKFISNKISDSKIEILKINIDRLITHLMVLDINDDSENFEEFYLFYRNISDYINQLYNHYPEDMKNIILYWGYYSDIISIYLNDILTIKENQQNFYELGNNLLNNIDLTVMHYTIYSQEKRELYFFIQLSLGVIALILIAIAFYLKSNIVAHLYSFLKTSDAMSNTNIDDESYLSNPHFQVCENGSELDEANIHIHNFLYRIDAVIKNVKQGIVESQKAAKELNDMSVGLESEISQLNDNTINKDSLVKYIDVTEDIAIESLEDLNNTANLLDKLQSNLNDILVNTKIKDV